MLFIRPSGTCFSSLIDKDVVIWVGGQKSGSRVVEMCLHS